MNKPILTFSLYLIAALTMQPALSAQIKVPGKPAIKSDKTVKPVNPVNPNQANDVQIVNTYELNIKNFYPYEPVVARLDDGRFFAAWEEVLLPADKATGTAMLFADNMQAAHVPVYFTEFMAGRFIEKNQVIPFSDGSLLVVYENQKDTKTRFVLFNDKFKIVKGPVAINDGAGATRLSAARLPGGKLAVIGFHTLGGTLGGFGKITIVNSSGEIVLPPTVFTEKGRIDDLSVSVLPNGLIVIAYALGFGRSIVLDQSGNVIRAETVFHPNQASRLNAVPLGNGNVMVVFRNQFYKPVCQVLDAQGNKAGPAAVIADVPVDGLQAVQLNNGNVLVCFNRSEQNPDPGLMLVVLDPAGKMVKGPSTVLDGYGTANSLFSLTAVRQDMALVFLGSWRSEGNRVVERKNGFLLVK